AGADAQPFGRRHRHGDDWQHLSLRHLSAHSRRRQAGGQGRLTMTSAMIENVSRRAILKGVASMGGLVIAVKMLPVKDAFAQAKKYGAEGMPHGTVNNPQVFVSIAPDGVVTIVCHRSEMGQGVRTGMPMIVADELEADWARVRVAQAPGDEARYGNQDTDGSRRTP